MVLSNDGKRYVVTSDHDFQISWCLWCDVHTFFHLLYSFWTVHLYETIINPLIYNKVTFDIKCEQFQGNLGINSKPVFNTYYGFVHNISHKYIYFFILKTKLTRRQLKMLGMKLLKFWQLWQGLLKNLTKYSTSLHIREVLQQIKIEKTFVRY